MVVTVSRLVAVKLQGKWRKNVAYSANPIPSFRVFSSGFYAPGLKKNAAPAPLSAPRRVIGPRDARR